MDGSFPHRGLLALFLTVSLIAACGREHARVDHDPADDGRVDHAGAAGEAWPDAEACDLLPGDPLRGGTIVLALGEPVRATHAPVPTNDAERTVFANLYETLTVVACDGTLGPGLAESWVRLDDGMRWRLHLRPGAVFWDGSSVTAVDVVMAWSRDEALARATGRPCPGMWLASGSRGLAVMDAQTLEVRLAEPQDDLPRLLAHPALAVAVRREGWHWPLGSGPCRLAADTERPLPDLVCRPNLHHPRSPGWQQFIFRIRPDGDPRDRLDSGVDLAVIRDHRAAAYYAEIDGVQSTPLPWDRIYVLLVPPDRDLAGRAAALSTRQAVTPAESRPWDQFCFHGCGRATCPQLHGPTVGIVTPPRDPDPALTALEIRRLVHPAHDPDARALAERIVAFADTPLELQSADGPELAAALQHGSAGAYVVRLEACYPTACLTTAALVARADWLQRDIAEMSDARAAGGRLQAWQRAIPLVQTRPRLIWHSRLAGLALTHDGALLVAGLGRTAPEATP